MLFNAVLMGISAMIGVVVGLLTKPDKWHVLIYPLERAVVGAVVIAAIACTAVPLFGGSTYVVRHALYLLAGPGITAVIILVGWGYIAFVITYVVSTTRVLLQEMDRDGRFLRSWLVDTNGQAVKIWRRYGPISERAAIIVYSMSRR
jgi:hypothetical protein